MQEAFVVGEILHVLVVFLHFSQEIEAAHFVANLDRYRSVTVVVHEWYLLILLLLLLLLVLGLILIFILDFFDIDR